MKKVKKTFRCGQWHTPTGECKFGVVEYHDGIQVQFHPAADTINGKDLPSLYRKLRAAA